MRMGEGGGKGRGGGRRVAAGLKAAVSTSSLGEALVAVIQLRGGHDRSCDWSTRASARPRRIFRFRLSPLHLPAPASAFPPLRAEATGPAVSCGPPEETPLEPPGDNPLFLSSA